MHVRLSSERSVICGMAHSTAKMDLVALQLYKITLNIREIGSTILGMARPWHAMDTNFY